MKFSRLSLGNVAPKIEGIDLYNPLHFSPAKFNTIPYIRPSVPVFLYIFQMMLTRKIGWVLLNSMSKKMFEFDSNTFHNFKDHFFKVNATNVIDDGLSLMNNQDGEPRFAFY